MITKDYDELFTFNALRRAHLRGRRCKRDKKPLMRFELTSLDHLYTLYDKLKAGKYKSAKYSTFVVEEPKRREIQTQPYENRIVQHVLCDDLLTPYFTARAITDNAACQKGKGEHFALDRFEKMIQTHIGKYGVTGYFLKCDILKYFPSIPHEKLKEIFCEEIADERIKKMLSDIIDSYHTKRAFLEKYGIEPLGEEDMTGRGVPIGNQTSQIFGMFYLNGIDRLVKEKLRIKVYTRYMDDFVLLHHDKEYLMFVYETLKTAVAKLGLQFNEKTQIIPIQNGVTNLGFRFFIGKKGEIKKVKAEGTGRANGEESENVKTKKGKTVIRNVKKSTKRRIRKRAKLLKKAYLDGIIPIERVNASKAAFHGHLKHGDCRRFEEELDRKLNFEDEE